MFALKRGSSGVELVDPPGARHPLELDGPGGGLRLLGANSRSTPCRHGGCRCRQGTARRWHRHPLSERPLQLTSRWWRRRGRWRLPPGPPRGGGSDQMAFSWPGPPRGGGCDDADHPPSSGPPRGGGGDGQVALSGGSTAGWWLRRTGGVLPPGPPRGGGGDGAGGLPRGSPRGGGGDGAGGALPPGPPRGGGCDGAGGALPAGPPRGGGGDGAGGAVATGQARGRRSQAECGPSQCGGPRRPCGRFEPATEATGLVQDWQ